MTNIEFVICKEIGDFWNDGLFEEVAKNFPKKVSAMTFMDPHATVGPCFLFIDRIAFNTTSNNKAILSDLDLPSSHKDELLIKDLVDDIIDSVLHELVHYLGPEDPDETLKSHMRVFRVSRILRELLTPFSGE